MRPRPDKLYKYYRPERVNVLESGWISYSPPNLFNDPFDTNPVVEMPTDDEFLEKKRREMETAYPHREGPTSEQWNALWKAEAERINKTLHDDLIPVWNSTTGVCCLSENPFDPLMLSHYASEHRGFVVEFDASNPFFGSAACVVYDDNRPIHSSPSSDDLWKVWMSKATCWSYENEWRSLAMLQSCRREVIQKGEEQITIYLHWFPKEAVTKVICGCRMTPQYVEYLRSNLRGWGYSCALEKAELHPKKYGFTFEKLSI